MATTCENCGDGGRVYCPICHANDPPMLDPRDAEIAALKLKVHEIRAFCETIGIHFAFPDDAARRTGHREVASAVLSILDGGNHG